MNGFTSQQIYNRIVEAAKHKKSLKALKNVKDGCDFLEEKNAITVSSVADFCAGREGGPKEQSIRNNKDLAGYIHARRAEQKLLTKPNQDEPEIRTGDAMVDAYIAGLQRELRIVVQRMNTLKEIFNKHVAEQGGFDLEASLKANRFVTKENPQADSPAIPGELRSILEKLLDPRRLASFGLIYGDGAVYSPERNDKVLVSKKDVDCLRQVIALLRAGTPVKV